MSRSSVRQFVGPLLALCAIVVVIALTTPSFLELQNFRNLALQAAILSIVAIGSTIVILTAGIDLSPGSIIAALTMTLAVLLRTEGLPLVPAVLLVVLAGAGLGAVNGTLVAYARIPSFIVTLAGLSAFKGLALIIGGGQPQFSLSPALTNPFYGSILGVPLPLFYVLILYGAATLLLGHTRLGREIYAVGGNDAAARLSGINVLFVRFLAFTIAGGAAGIGAVLLAARLNSGSPNYGTLIELQAIAASVVGGASLAGGRGHILNTLVGVLIIVVVQNGLNLNAISTSVQSITIGSIIVLAVGLDIWRGSLGGLFHLPVRKSTPKLSESKQ